MSENWENSVIHVKNKYLLPSAKLDDQKYEFVFVLDRSGSMGGTSIELARQACVMFLRSLPVDCYFNIIGFGTRYQTLFPTSVKYGQDTLNQAVAYAQKMDASMGGNEVELPLLHVYNSSGILGYMTQIFLLTDGCQEFGTARISTIAKVVSDNETRGRVFTLGIGRQASVELVNRVAEAGNGTSEFVLGDDRIQTKVLNQLKHALRSPLLKAVRIENRERILG
ncbi:von Willebrand factor A domain-containing protein 5A isoform X2 [Folsomia candida]|uniref:von Willebrand factor A domain-containing protein 5A isoform X2 n=1 Tax=Folsomia candida TaxID=158441 RepID=UPI000B8F2C0F|nr:von Willebrand factor A domain-containing protein 5A isoform X2 [Folsomia candida]